MRQRPPDAIRSLTLHHKDDIIETMLLSLMFEGRFYTFPPKTFLDRTELTVIRPLMYVSEADVIGFKNKYNLPVCKNPCPADGHTKREYVKNLTKQLNKENPGIKERLFHAVISGNIEGGILGISEWLEHLRRWLIKPVDQRRL